MKLSELRNKKVLEAYDVFDGHLTGDQANFIRSCVDAGAKAVMDEAEKLAAILEFFDDPSMCGADDDCFSDAGKLICRYCLTATALARWNKFKESNDEPG